MMTPLFSGYPFQGKHIMILDVHIFIKDTYYLVLIWVFELLLKSDK